MIHSRASHRRTRRQRLVYLLLSATLVGCGDLDELALDEISEGRTPYAVATVPGTIQAEHYDTGGEGVAYHDVEPANLGRQLRTGGVDIGVCSDADGGYYVGWTRPGEWLEYTVRAASAQTLSVRVRVASRSAGGRLRIQLGNAAPMAAVDLPVTGSWGSWRTVTAGTVALTAGTHVLRVLIVEGGFDLNYLELVGSASKLPRVPRWSVHTVSLSAARSYSNPYTEAEVTAQVSGPGGRSLKVRGFWDGGASFKLRITPTVLGTWSYVTSSADAGLHGRHGSLECVAPPAGARGFVRVDPSYPRSFKRDDGSRFFMLGHTHYSIIKSVRADGPWRTTIDNTAAHGMTKVRMLLYPWAGMVPYPDSQPFAGSSAAPDHNRLDLVHWQRFDQIVEYLAARGLVVDLILFTDSQRAFGTQAQDQRYLRYALARYAAYPHVIWCLANEWDLTVKAPSYWDALGAIVRSEDPWIANGTARRALSIHQRTRPDFEYMSSAWPTHAIIQYGTRNRERFVNADEWGSYGIVYNHKVDPSIPVVNDEYGYVGEPDRSEGEVPLTRTKHRQAAWAIYTSGGSASAGDGRTFAGAGGYWSGDWHEASEWDDLQRLSSFWQSGVEYWRMSFSPATVKSGNRVYCLARAGHEYVAYAAVGGAFSLNLPVGTYEARRFDPRTGTSAELPDVSGGSVKQFSFPSTTDWVLHLRLR